MPPMHFSLSEMDLLVNEILLYKYTGYMSTLVSSHWHTHFSPNRNLLETDLLKKDLS